MAALKQGKEVVDRQVENALFKSAMGFTEKERKYEPVLMPAEEYYLAQQVAVNRFKLENPNATKEEIELVKMQVSKYKMECVEIKEKVIAPNTTAQIFWLKNRKPAEWRDKQEVKQESSGEIKIVFDDDMKKWSE